MTETLFLVVNGDKRGRLLTGDAAALREVPVEEARRLSESDDPLLIARASLAGSRRLMLRLNCAGKPGAGNA